MGWMRNAPASACPALVALALGAAACGCAARGVPPEAPGPRAAAGGQAAAASPLAGTSWRLVEFQSMSDEVGTRRPDDPSRYVMRLGADGTVRMQLDCNRAQGTWSAEPGSEATRGRFAFGPLAATRALCPPPHLDELIARQSEYVRSYVLEDGRLHLGLMADGGIQVWEPLRELPFRTEPDAEIEAAIVRAAPAYTRASVEIDGRHYVERQRLPADAEPQGVEVLTGELTFERGIPLEPPR